MSMTGDRLLVGGIISARDFRIFQIRSVIDESANLHPVHELRDAPNVIAMIVRDQHVIELLNPGLVGSSHDPVGVAAF